MIVKCSTGFSRFSKTESHHKISGTRLINGIIPYIFFENRKLLQ